MFQSTTLASGTVYPIHAELIHLIVGRNRTTLWPEDKPEVTMTGEGPLAVSTTRSPPPDGHLGKGSGG